MNNIPDSSAAETITDTERLDWLLNEFADGQAQHHLLETVDEPRSVIDRVIGARAQEASVKVRLGGVEVPVCNPVSRVGDMGEGLKLMVFKEDDGDFIVSVIPQKHRGPMEGQSVQFCTPMSGGGKSARTWKALLELWRAMQADVALETAAPLNEKLAQSHAVGAEYQNTGDAGVFR